MEVFNCMPILSRVLLYRFATSDFSLAVNAQLACAIICWCFSSWCFGFCAKTADMPTGRNLWSQKYISACQNMTFMVPRYKCLLNCVQGRFMQFSRTTQNERSSLSRKGGVIVPKFLLYLLLSLAMSRKLRTSWVFVGFVYSPKNDSSYSENYIYLESVVVLLS